jgi:hypothetical protein
LEHDHEEAVQEEHAALRRHDVHGRPAMPSTASATSWDVVGTTHVLDSTNLSFSVPALSAGMICTNSSFDVDVRTSAQLTVTSGTFDNCEGAAGSSLGCTVTATATRLPWTVTASSTTSVSINGVHIDLTYAGGCSLAGTSVTLTGNLGGGVWNQPSHQVTYSGGTGLTQHIPGLGSFPMTLSGTIRDTQQTLTLTD